MGHCVGRGGYDTGTTIISLRDGNNMPHCTIQWDEASRTVVQLQGRANQQVHERYHGAVCSFIDGLRPLHVNGAGKFGHVLANGKLMHWSELPEGAVVEGDLDLNHCSGLTHLPEGLVVGGDLILSYCTDLVRLPDELKVAGNADLQSCKSLTHIPAGVVVKGYLNLNRCTSLTRLPDGFKRNYDAASTGTPFILVLSTACQASWSNETTLSIEARLPYQKPAC